MVDKCLALADWLEQSGPNKDVEAQDLMARLTLDVVLMAGFGIASNTLTAPGPVPLLKELHFAMDESFRYVTNGNTANIHMQSLLSLSSSPS